MNYYSLEVGDLMVYVYFLPEHKDPDMHLLLEAKHRGSPIGGPYSVIQHPPRFDKAQKHIHVFKKENELFALNQDGTAHDRSHRIQIPQKVADGLLKHFPHIKIPPNLFIEGVETTIGYRLIMEFKSENAS